MDCYLKAKWKYKAEGNKHVVVSNGNKCCLRLRKCDSISHFESIASESDNEDDAILPYHIKDIKLDELEYIQFVVIPLLNFSDVCHMPKVVKLPAKFLRELDCQIEEDRPKHRIHQTLSLSSPALLLHDHCFIPSSKQLEYLAKHNVKLSSDVFSVEIKLKKGFVTRADENTLQSKLVCQFCKTQLFRVLKEKRHSSCSSYCPLDLFSGNEKQMKNALHSLFLCPQNNLRLFHNGELVYSQEILDAILSKRCSKGVKFNQVMPTDKLVEELLPQLLSCIEISSIDLHTIVHILHKALLLPIVSQSQAPFTLVSGECNGEKYKKLLCNDLICPGASMQSFESKTTSLPSNSILGLILSQQKRALSSLAELQNSLEAIDSFVNQHCDSKDALNVDAPYDSVGWKSFVSNPHRAEDHENVEINEVNKMAHQLRQFFVAKSFCDCSVMLAFQRVKSPAEEWLKLKDIFQFDSTTSANFNVISDNSGNDYIVSIAIVDTDPKYSSNLSFYQEKYSEISLWWNNVLQSF